VLEVRDPDGGVWRIRRRWAAQRIRVRRRDLVDVSFADVGGLFDGAPSGLALLVTVVIVGAVLVFVVLPIAAFLLELLILAILVAGYVAGRVLLRRPWDIDVRGDGYRRTLHVHGWRASRRAMRDLAAALERGEAPSALLDPAGPSAGSAPR
jgi:hypothetical protein